LPAIVGAVASALLPSADGIVASSAIASLDGLVGFMDASELAALIESCCLARPKSRTLIEPSDVTITFAALMSR
jgi:hypothetical protein